MGGNGYCVAVCHLSSDQFVANEIFGVPSDSIGADLTIFTADGAIEGHVFNLDTGAPIPFAGVDAYGNNGTISMGGTDENGFYHLPVVNDTYTVGAFAEGFEEGHVEGIVVLDNTVNVDFSLQQRTSGFPDVFSVRDFPDDQGRMVIVG